MMTYFCFMSMLVGGFYLAIDTTAGERERGSLEPLLSLPVSRAELIFGKMLATGGLHGGVAAADARGVRRRARSSFRSKRSACRPTSARA